MFFKIIALCIVLRALEVHCDCKNFFECLGDFIKDFIGKNASYNSFQIENYMIRIVPKLYADNSSGVDESLKKIERDLVGMSDDDIIDNLLIRDLESDMGNTKTYNNSKVLIKIKALGRASVKQIENRTNEESRLQKINNNQIQEEKQNNIISRVHATENLKKNIEKSIVDYEIDTLYYSDTDNDTDYPIIDYIDLYKDTTNEIVEYTTTMPVVNTASVIQLHIDETENDISSSNNQLIPQAETTEVMSTQCTKKRTSVSEAFFPWIATIFVKNATNDGQYDYYCDGALLSHKAVLTSSRCVSLPNETLAAKDLLVVLGKRSLQATRSDEDFHLVAEIRMHENFTNENAVSKHDLVILLLEGSTNFGEEIQPACLQTEPRNDVELAVTAGWNVSGEITSINFGKEKSKTCLENEEMENLFCATYGDDTSVCPSYGGLYVTRTKEDLWYLEGVMSGDPTDRICVNRTVKYTDISRYLHWIYDIVNAKL